MSCVEKRSERADPFAKRDDLFGNLLGGTCDDQTREGLLKIEPRHWIWRISHQREASEALAQPLRARAPLVEAEVAGRALAVDEAQDGVWLGSASGRTSLSEPVR